MTSKSLRDQWESAMRELRLRRVVYPKCVKAGAMTEEHAAHEIACMEAIVATLSPLMREERERVQPRLL